MYDMKILSILVTFQLLFSAAGSDIPIRASRFADGLRSMRFLISVNDTWAGPGGCLATVATPPLTPGQKYNETLPIQIGDCDHGPMTFTVSKTFGQTSDLYHIDVTFYSSVIEDASPPSCHIGWNATYFVPTSDDITHSLLPGCFVMDSREGYHMTYYWFYILEWDML
ncbi:uncharacterized protein LOC135469224 [Liolophura sinensis]|uniref:uncharacterized protein LOC135469224 n=1 Tax=Liolophura sinensis TaxID=3198878 RepID=UPI0031586C1B